MFHPRTLQVVAAIGVVAWPACDAGPAPLSAVPPVITQNTGAAGAAQQRGVAISSTGSPVAGAENRASPVMATNAGAAATTAPAVVPPPAGGSSGAAANSDAASAGTMSAAVSSNAGRAAAGAASTTSTGSAGATATAGAASAGSGGSVSAGAAGGGVCGGSTPHGCYVAAADNPMGCPPQIHEQSAYYPPTDEWVSCSSPWFTPCNYTKPEGGTANCACDSGVHWLCTY
jgi:hypothetical protein